MPFNPRPPIACSALNTLAAAVATATVAGAVMLAPAAQAAGLGKLTVLSALGQPLRAEIELTSVSNDEAAGLAAKLASPDAFRSANVELNPALLALNFAIEQRNGRQFIRISSPQPLNEPFVDLLLELTWNNGRLVREYTFLLDPAELRTTQSAQVAPTPAVRARSENQAARSQEPAPAVPASRTRPERAARGDEAAAPGAVRTPGSEYRVRQGDTLGRIAAQVKPVDISLDMMLVALYRANPDAFIGNNMNRLKSGQVLSVPDSDTLHATGAGEARGVVVAHAADFNAYRNKLAGQVATAAPAKAPQASQSAAGKISAKVEERPTAANEAEDQLKLSKAAPSAGAGGKGSAASVEERIAREKELADANTRVKELEKNVGDLEKLVTVKNKAGTDAANVANNAANNGATSAANAAPVNVAAETEPALAPEPEPARPAPAATPAPKAATPSPASAPSFADMIMDNIMYVGAGTAALLLALLGINARRKRKDAPLAKKPSAATSILGLPTEPVHSMFAEAGGQSVDTNNSVFNSSFAPSASQLDTNEVDPVAEADVYIAYGRDAQAEEILKEALRNHPERFPVRLKLLEIYAARKDLRAFETQASELYSMTRGQGDEWAQAAVLGLSIDALNPLYAAPTGAPSAERPAQQAMLAKQPEDPFRSGGPAEHGAPAMAAALTKDAGRTALPAASVAAAQARADEDHSLDFDIATLDFEPIAGEEQGAKPAAAREEPSTVPDLEFVPLPDLELTALPAPAETELAAVPAPEEERFDLAFDMNFDAPAAPPARAAQPAQHVSLDLADEPAGNDYDMADLSKQFDLPPVSAATQPRAPEDELKDPLFDLEAVNFDLPATAQSPAAPGEPFDPFADDPFALPDAPAATPASMASSAPRFDIADIDLELPSSDDGQAPEVELVGADVGELSATQMEMETKLDLAIAYQEIGDKEGARELLDEVIKGGNSTQSERANAMRAKLA